MQQLTLQPVKQLRGQVNLPGSKSLSNRALLLAALANGTSRLVNLLDSDDIRFMLQALTQLGVTYQLSEDKTECQIVGLGGRMVCQQVLELFLGNAGTAMIPYISGGCPR